MLPPYEEEELPAYKPALILTGAMYTKRELSSPFRRSFNRSWKPTWVVLDNTQLKLTRGTVMSRERAYTLQYAEIGFASDYDKRQHTLRIRVEGFQFLFALGSHAECLQWIQSVQTAIGLALPLELRTLPEDKRRRRRRRRHRRRDRNNENENENQSETAANSTDNAETCDNSGACDNSCGIPDTETEPPRPLSFGLSPTPSRDADEIVAMDDIEQEDGGMVGEFDSADTSASASVSDESQSATVGELSHAIEVMDIGPKTTQPDLELVVRHDLEEDSDLANGKWSPTRRRSRVSAFDFPHLPINLSWEGKKILYRGRWAVVRKRQINDIYMR